MHTLLASSTFMSLAQASGQSGGSGNADDSLLLWGVLLVGVAIVLFVVEIFVPSGGVIGIFAVLALAAGIIMIGVVNRTLGIVGAALALVALPIGFFYSLKILPYTPVWRALTLTNENERDESPYDEAGQERAAAERTPDANAALVGRTGVARSDLRPIGACVIDGQRMDCMAVGGVIESGERVEVVSAEGMQIKVRAKRA